MTPAQAIAIFLLAIVALSFRFYLSYLILEKIEATELMWFLFVINIPLYIILTVAREGLRK